MVDQYYMESLPMLLQVNFSFKYWEPHDQLPEKLFDKISYNSFCTFNFRLNLEFAWKERDAQSILALLAFSFDKKLKDVGGGGRGFVRIDFYYFEAEIRLLSYRGQL